MKIYKLQQGSTFENLKHFIYLTNEYGLTSEEFIDGFIDNFGKIILNGNFTFNQNQYRELDEFWENIKQDCINNDISYNENYNSLFYETLSNKNVVDNVLEELWQNFLNTLNTTELNKSISVKSQFEGLEATYDKLVSKYSNDYYSKILKKMKIGIINEIKTTLTNANFTAADWCESVNNEDNILEFIKEIYNKTLYNILDADVKIELLKQFILAFDKYIKEGSIFMENVYFDNTPDLVRGNKSDKNGRYIEVNGKNSKIWYDAYFYENNHFRIFPNEILLEEFNDDTITSVNKATQVLKGRFDKSYQGWDYWTNIYGRSIKDYRKIQTMEIVKSDKNIKIEIPTFIIDYIKVNIQGYDKETAILEINGYDEENLYFHWNYITGALRWIQETDIIDIQDDDFIKKFSDIKKTLYDYRKKSKLKDIIIDSVKLDKNGEVAICTCNAAVIKYDIIDGVKLKKLIKLDDINNSNNNAQNTNINYKKYKLISKYVQSDKDNLIGSQLFKDGIPIGTIISDTEVNINGENIDIGKYIFDNNIINLYSIGVKYAMFNKIYEEIK